MQTEQLKQLLYEALETEMGGVQVYETAIRCAVNEDLKEEWERYLEQTQKHEQIVRDLCDKFGLDAETETSGRQVVRHIGESLVKAMEIALESGKPEAAQIVAAECVVEAETKDHLNWELLAQVAHDLSRLVRIRIEQLDGDHAADGRARRCGQRLDVVLVMPHSQRLRQSALRHVR